MASKGPNKTWDNIHILDCVGPLYGPVQMMPLDRKARILLLSNFSLNDAYSAMLLHEEGHTTFLRGRWPELGLDVPEGFTTERVIAEIRGRRVVQAIISRGAGAYIVTDDGVLFSCGQEWTGMLGRPVDIVPSTKFGRVAMDDAVLAVAVGFDHVLVMTATKVLAFGSNVNREAGVFGTDYIKEPVDIYHGAGPRAPQQVACGNCHSVILTVGGQVFTCGAGNYIGHGRENGVQQMTLVSGLSTVFIKQIGCTVHATYALSDRNLYFWGKVEGSISSISTKDKYIMEPVILPLDKHRIVAFRCSSSMVVALTDTNEAFYWGECSDGTVINSLRSAAGYIFPREVFSMGEWHDSGGTVYMDMRENHERLFAAVNEVQASNEEKLKEAEAKNIELRNALEEYRKRETVLEEARASNEDKLQEAEVKIVELQNALQDSRKRANQVKRLTEDENDELRSRILSLQQELDFAKEQIVHKDNVSNEAQSFRELARDMRASNLLVLEEIQQISNEAQNFQEAILRELKAPVSTEIEKACRGAGSPAESKSTDLGSKLVALHLERGRDIWQDVSDADHTSDFRVRISEIEKENRELNMENRELRMEIRELKTSYRELTLDYRELNTEHQKLPRESDQTQSGNRTDTN